MKKIFKYVLKTTDIQSITTYADHKILCVQVQHGNPCLWAIVDLESEEVITDIYIFGTGYEINIDINKLNYIDTYQLANENFIGHVFERIN